MKRFVRWIAFTGPVLMVAAFGIWWEVYKYHDCKKVGHSTLYCVMAGGR